jgi:hypothetical protein
MLEILLFAVNVLSASSRRLRAFQSCGWPTGQSSSEYFRKVRYDALNDRL